MSEMASVHDVAAYIHARHGAMSAMKLQKLCYYSQAWSLVWDQEPLFAERIEAWGNGPVVRELYRRHADCYCIGSSPDGNPDRFSSDQRETVDAVLEAYGKLTAQQLSELTHREQPWITARGGVAPTVCSNAAISHESMASFYGSLVDSGDSVDV